MDNSFPVAEAQLVSLFTEAVSYGIYLVTFGMCMNSLFFGRSSRRNNRNWPMIIVALTMFIFATFTAALGLKFCLDAFIFYQGPGGPQAVFFRISYWVNVMKTVDVQMMTLIGDAMLIYRCLVVYLWNWWIIAIPLLLWLGNIACSINIINITATLHNPALLNTSKLSPWHTAFLSLTLVTNVVSTGLIVWRIWQVSKDTSVLSVVGARKGSRSKLSNVIRIIIESALLYTALVLITFGTVVAGSNAIYCVADVMVMTVGISFNLIIIRVDKGVAVGTTYMSTNSKTTNSIPLHLRNPQKGVSGGLEITISEDVERASDNGSGTQQDAGSIKDNSEMRQKWSNPV